MSKKEQEKAKKRLAPGDYGYINAHKRRQAIKVVLWAVLIAAIITGGILYTGTRFNELTIIGIVLVLPASKSLIGLIIIGRYHTGSREEYEKIRALAQKNSHVLSDLVLTRYEGSMLISIAVVHGGNIFAYVPTQKNTPEKIRAYLGESVKAAGGEASPAVYTDFTKYCDFIKKISAAKSGPGKKDDRIVSDVLSRAV